MSWGECEAEGTRAVVLGEEKAGGFKRQQSSGVQSKGGWGARWEREQGRSVGFPDLLSWRND